MNKGRIAVLTSGGIDSNILVAKMLKKYEEVYPIYIRSGLNWESAELYWLKKYLRALRQKNLKKNLKPLMILDMPVSDVLGGWAITSRGTPNYHSPDEDVFLPGRNLLLLSKAATFCALKKIPRIALGTLSSNPFPDATPDFFRRFEETAGTALDFPIKILTPFARFKKREIAKKALKAKDSLLHLSFSCLAPRGIKPCGRCNKCAESEGMLGG